MITLTPGRPVTPRFSASTHTRTVEDEFANGTFVSMMRASKELREMAPEKRFKVALNGYERLEQVRNFTFDWGNVHTLAPARTILGDTLWQLKPGDLSDEAKETARQLLEKVRPYATEFRGREAMRQMKCELEALIA